MVVSKKYLVLHTDSNAPEKQVVAENGKGELLFSLQIRAAATGIPFYLDVGRFAGESINFFCGKDRFVFDGETDDIPLTDCEAESFRPLLHYTVPHGWLNDPNGLIFYDGKYHIFCQHNPLSTAWGNMHWYHSATTDFVNFEHIGDALFPDSTGTMFSGSAICDTENVSGLGKNALLLYYTIAEYADGLHKPEFSQGLAYSTDGIHFEKYPKNPVVPNIKGENRDPKVVYVPEMHCYVMALYLEGDEYCLLKSDNLTDWVRFQTLRLENDGECPDLYYIKDSGKWIFSGASDSYIVGNFDENGFVEVQQPLRYYRELDGRHSYAAQTFSGTDGKALRMTWENISPENGQRFCGQLSIPAEMSTVTLNDGQIRLKSDISGVIKNNLKLFLSEKAGEYNIPFSSYVAYIGFGAEDFTVKVDGAILNINAIENTVSFGEKAIPLSLSGNRNICLVVDTMSIEIFADDGLVFSAVKFLCNKKTRKLTVSGNDIEIKVFYYGPHEQTTDY